MQAVQPQWVRNAEAVARRDAKLPEVIRPNISSVVVQSEPERPQYLGPRKAIYSRFWWWLYAALFMPKRVFRAGTWIWLVPQRMVSLIRTVCSESISVEAKSRRNAACAMCKHQIIRFSKSGKQRGYCGKCGCPEWPLAELRYKNTKRGWYCPIKRHDGEYPGDEWLQNVPEQLRESVRQAGTSGCKGCGKGGG